MATGLASSFRDESGEGTLEVRADASILLTKQCADAVLSPAARRFRTGGYDAGDRIEHGDGAVEDAQGALDFGREVDVARRVDDVDAVIAPETGGGRRRDGDAALLLLLHPVHDGGAIVDFAILYVIPV